MNYTQESLNLFCNEMQTNMNKLNEQMIVINTKVESLSKLEDKINNLEIKQETNKLIINEKIEHLIYKLSVIDDKININTQKVNDLNNVLIKHFAYKMYKPNQIQQQQQQQQQSPQGTTNNQFIPPLQQQTPFTFVNGSNSKNL